MTENVDNYVALRKAIESFIRYHKDPLMLKKGDLSPSSSEVIINAKLLKEINILLKEFKPAEKVEHTNRRVDW